MHVSFIAIDNICSEIFQNWQKCQQGQRLWCWLLKSWKCLLQLGQVCLLHHKIICALKCSCFSGQSNYCTSYPAENVKWKLTWALRMEICNVIALTEYAEKNQEFELWTSLGTDEFHMGIYMSQWLAFHGSNRGSMFQILFIYNIILLDTSTIL